MTYPRGRRYILFFWYFIFGCCFLTSIYSQHIAISGYVYDENGNALLHAMTKIYPVENDSLLAFQMTTSEGQFEFAVPTIRDSLRIEVAYLGYKSYSKNISTELYEPLSVHMEVDTTDLETITIVDKHPPMTRHGDTTRY